jgi:membrane protein implicated in regulation of membrane protease activity
VFTVLGFSMGFLALGAAVAVLEVLATVLAVAFCIYASLALIGVVVFSVIGVRRLIARRDEQRQPPQPQLGGAYQRSGRFR